MLSYMRNKTVGVRGPDNGLLYVHGLLDDSIYSLWVDLEVEVPSGAIAKIDGRFLRYTTPDCPAALEHLNAAMGKKVTDSDLMDHINKSVGRAGCRHFANLILECCDTAAKTLEMSQGIGGSLPSPQDGNRVEIAKPAASGNESGKIKAVQPRELKLKPAGRGFYLDLHSHTFPASQCASDSADQMIRAAKKMGLDGICLTDHNFIWDPDKIERLKDDHGFLVLAGTEITCVEGDFLVFGLSRSVEGIVNLESLRSMVDRENGVIIAAHPFRGFLVVGGDSLKLDVESAMNRPIFKQVDAVEVLNSRLNVKENQLAREIADELNLPATGGSDAHKIEDVGRCVTRFDVRIADESELVAALFSGKYTAEPAVPMGKKGAE